ncbi:SUMF1/EgtB/PvdO family nonheme iron enzyme [Candidatus Thiothrix phosphatis]|uniref:SUMF1/EgtB/PvdO family nonheme iron enzyme n=1 Tax=Candidatus Thiothrix phosphatis TaxID=3112415 RepID=UPI0035C8E147
MLRGGSWNNKPDWLRSSARNRNNTDNRNNNVGFRVLRSASPPQLPESGCLRSGGACIGVSMTLFPGCARTRQPNRWQGSGRRGW